MDIEKLKEVKDKSEIKANKIKRILTGQAFSVSLRNFANHMFGGTTRLIQPTQSRPPVSLMLYGR